MKSFRLISIVVIILGVNFACTSKDEEDVTADGVSGEKTELEIVFNEDEGTISVYRAGENEPIVKQHAREDFRPYIHPIVAPDGRGVLTEDSPGHHTHQTGLYWGFTSVNGRDFFHNPDGDYWRKVSAGIVERSDHLHGSRFHDHDHDHSHDHYHDHGFAGFGEETIGTVQWQTVYDLLDENGETMLTETQKLVDG